jgi:hypothetical protein
LCGGTKLYGILASPKAGVRPLLAIAQGFRRLHGVGAVSRLLHEDAGLNFLKNGTSFFCCNARLFCRYSS